MAVRTSVKNAKPTPFEVGQIKAHANHGLNATHIAKIITKANGISHWSDIAVQDAMNKLSDEPTWRGDRTPGSGVQQKTTKTHERDVCKEVLKKRCQRKVCAPYLKRVFRWAKKLSQFCLGQHG